MENNKYYTPEIEEFYVGFEYEQEDINEGGSSLSWYKHSIKKGQDIDELEKAFKYGLSYRVKYLDKEDIESLGFEGQQVNTVYFKRDGYRLVHWLDNPRSVQVYRVYNKLEEERIFDGIIKNKSELKKLLKQLKIIK